MFHNPNRFEDESVFMGGRCKIRSRGHLQELGDSYEIRLVNMHGKILEYVVGA